MIFFKIMTAQQEIEESVMAEIHSQRQFLIKTGLKGNPEGIHVDSPEGNASGKGSSSKASEKNQKESKQKA